MKIILAPDSFKGSLSSQEAAAAMAEGILRAADARLVALPMADGGEGTAAAIVSFTGGVRAAVDVRGPLGDMTRAEYGILPDGTAVMEMAQASGITLVERRRLDPLRASTYGTGELIRAALDTGCARLCLGIGGSATNDGGMGMAEALGVRFLDGDGNALQGCGAALDKISRIDVSGLDSRIRNTEFTVLCDVTNPLCGPEGASAVFGPQKGAAPEQVKLLDAGLKNYADRIREALGSEVCEIPGAGAAGGLGAGLMAFCGAKLVPGCETILNLYDFDGLLKGADLVMTGEGRLDGSTGFGKAPNAVALRAKKLGVPVVAVAGSVAGPPGGAFAAAESAVTDIVTLEYALEHAYALVADAAERIMRLILLGRNMK